MWKGKKPLEIRILIFIEAMERYKWEIKLADSLGNHENQDISAAKSDFCASFWLRNPPRKTAGNKYLKMKDP